MQSQAVIVPTQFTAKTNNFGGDTNKPPTSPDKSHDPLEMVPKVDDFKTFVTKYQDFYIDKSSFIRQIIERNDAKPILIITRPKGWGKTTNLTMLKQFIQKKVDDKGNPYTPQPNYNLFAGGSIKITEEIDDKPEPMLEDPQKKPTIFDFIMKSEEIHRKPHSKTQTRTEQFNLRPLKKILKSKEQQQKCCLHCEKDFATHPVIFVDFGKVTGDNFSTLKNQILNLILGAYQDHNYLKATEYGPQYKIIHKHINQTIRAPEKVSWNPLDVLFVNLIDILQTYYKESCYLLIDNYDYPVLKIMKNDMRQIREMTALLASLFSDFQIKNYIPPSSELKTQNCRGKRFSSARAILMGKTNIFSAYLNCYIHHGVGDPTFNSEFGINHEEIVNKLLPEILTHLKSKGNHELKSNMGFNSIKEKLSQTIRQWYGGYIEQQEDQLVLFGQKFNYENIWDFLKSYIKEGVICEPKSFSFQTEYFDEKWYLQRLFETLNINQMLSFQNRNPPKTKIVISDFLSAGQTNTYFSQGELLHIGYSMGYLTGYFVPQKQSKIQVSRPHFPNLNIIISRPHFPNLNIIQKCKDYILNNIRPYFFHNLLDSKLIINRLDLMDENAFKKIVEKITNKIASIQNRDIFALQTSENTLVKGIINYWFLNESDPEYASAHSIQNGGSLKIDNIYLKTTPSDEKDKRRLILVEIGHTSSSLDDQIKNTLLRVLRSIYENPESLRRMARLLQKQKITPLLQSVAIVRVGVLNTEARHPNYKITIMNDIEHSYDQLIKLLNFFQESGEQWQSAFFTDQNSPALNAKQYLETVNAISRGEVEEIYEQMISIFRQRKKIKHLNEEARIRQSKIMNEDRLLMQMDRENSAYIQQRFHRDGLQLIPNQSNSNSLYNYNYKYQTEEEDEYDSDESAKDFTLQDQNGSRHASQQLVKRRPRIKSLLKLNEIMNFNKNQRIKNKNIMINYSSAFDKKSFYYYDNNCSGEGAVDNQYRTRKFNYPILDEEEDREANAMGQVEKRLYGRKYFKP